MLPGAGTAHCRDVAWLPRAPQTLNHILRGGGIQAAAAQDSGRCQKYAGHRIHCG